MPPPSGGGGSVVIDDAGGLGVLRLALRRTDGRSAVSALGCGSVSELFASPSRESDDHAGGMTQTCRAMASLLLGLAPF